MWGMNRKIFNYFEIAARTALSKEDCRSFLLGAVGVRFDGTMVKALNSAVEFPDRRVHAEFRVARKLDYGATVYVARVRFDNFEFGMARPCAHCRRVLLSKRVEKVYYTVNRYQYGVWLPETDTDYIYRN
jgi:hypothetical protein